MGLMISQMMAWTYKCVPLPLSPPPPHTHTHPPTRTHSKTASFKLGSAYIPVKRDMTISFKGGPSDLGTKILQKY